MCKYLNNFASTASDCHWTCIILSVSSGILSKSKGQVLRVAACRHILFCEVDGDDDKDVGVPSIESIPSIISKEAIVAAENFVVTCCQHAAFMAGRGKIEEELSKLATGIPK